MLGFSTLKSAIDYLLITGIVSKVYHDVYILETDKGRFPVYDEGDEKIYVGVDDTQIMNCYFRQTGEAIFFKSEFVGSQKKIFKARAPFRVVFFNDYEERSFDSLTDKIMKLSLFENIEFSKVYIDREQIRILEGDRKNFNFGGKTFYKAIDINVNFTTVSDDCNKQIECDALPNPIAGCVPIIQRTNDELDPIWNAQKINYYTKIQVDNLFFYDAIAGQNLSGGRVVYIDNGKAFYFDPSDETLSGYTLGITKNAALLNDPVKVQTYGVFYESGLGLVADTKYFIGPNGTLISSVAGLKVVQQIGVSLTTDKIALHFYSSIITI